MEADFVDRTEKNSLGAKLKLTARQSTYERIAMVVRSVQNLFSNVIDC